MALKTTQEIVPIEEIREGVLILSDGGLRAILMASSLNFGLKSAEEQEAIIYQYQNFLNSLDFPIQFFIQSRKLDINSYLQFLEDLEKKQAEELLKIQTSEYRFFIKNLVELGNIVAKMFFIIVPYNLPIIELKTTGVRDIVKPLASVFKTAKKEPFSPQKFEEYRTQLWQRINTVTQGLARLGVKAAPLNTEEVVELFYSLYNPVEAERGKMPTG